MSNQLLTSARLFGRLNGLLLLILKKNSIDIDTLANKTLLDIYLETLKYATEHETSVINSLMSKHSDRAKSEGTSIKTEYADNQQKLGFYEAKYLFDTKKDISLLLHDVDLIENNTADKFVVSKSIKYFMGIIAIFVVFLIIYNLPYFQDKRYYNKVQDRQSLYVCNEYIKEFPSGRYLDDVLYMKVNLSRNMNFVMDYLNGFPEGKYADVVNNVCDSLWNIEIKKYQNRDKDGQSQEAIQYMTSMLEYMKLNRINTLNLKISPNILLRNYSEYDDNIKQICEFISEYPVASNMLLLRENFKTQDLNKLAGILVSGMQKSIDKIFTPNFVEVKYNGSTPHSPKVSINYFIRNQSIDNEGKYPSIWTYEENGIFKKYLLGISIDFEAVFTIPGENIVYRYKESGDPGSSISNISSIQDGYKQMSQVCFAQFSNTMADKLGLEQVYFQGEE